MAINFPDNPTVGDNFTSNGKTWQWNDTAWVLYGHLPGATSTGFPAGGTGGQVLTKVDETDYNADWEDVISADGGTPSTWTRVLVAIDAGGV